MKNITKLEALIKEICAEYKQPYNQDMKQMVEYLRYASENGKDNEIVHTMKKVFLDLATENGVKEEHQKFYLYFISRINKDFNILLN